jgi:hypothetical protein
VNPSIKKIEQSGTSKFWEGGVARKGLQAIWQRKGKFYFASTLKYAFNFLALSLWLIFSFCFLGFLGSKHEFIIRYYFTKTLQKFDNQTFTLKR